MMVRFQGAMSAGWVGFPRPGPSPNAVPAAPARTSTTRTSTGVSMARLRIDMPDLPFAVDRPAGDGVEMLARESGDRRRLGGLAAQRHELRPGRLHVAA